MPASYSLYRALAVAAGQLDPGHRPDLTNTAPAAPIGPFPQWAEPDQIVSLDPWGHLVGEAFADRLAEGWDIRPTIAVTRARINMPEIVAGDRAPAGLRPTATVLTEAGDARVTKVAIEPVWWLPGVARRFGIDETDAAPRAVRADRRHVSRTGHPAGPAMCSCRRSAA